MRNEETQKLLEQMKQHMKRHSIVSYDVGVFETRMGFIRLVPKGWEKLLVPIKGYHRDVFELDKIMLLQGELYFIVRVDHETYEIPSKKTKHRFVWDEVVKFVEATKWTQLNWSYGGKGHDNWEISLLKSLESGLKYYDPQEEAKSRNTPRLTEKDIEILIKAKGYKTSWLEDVVDRICGY